MVVSLIVFITEAKGYVIRKRLGTLLVAYELFCSLSFAQELAWMDQLSVLDRSRASRHAPYASKLAQGSRFLSREGEDGAHFACTRHRKVVVSEYGATVNSQVLLGCSFAWGWSRHDAC
jgi:hypothetical protein